MMSQRLGLLSAHWTSSGRIWHTACAHPSHRKLRVHRNAASCSAWSTTLTNSSSINGNVQINLDSGRRYPIKQKSQLCQGIICKHQQKSPGDFSMMNQRNPMCSSSEWIAAQGSEEIKVTPNSALQRCEAGISKDSQFTGISSRSLIHSSHTMSDLRNNFRVFNHISSWGSGGIQLDKPMRSSVRLIAPYCKFSTSSVTRCDQAGDDGKSEVMSEKELQSDEYRQMIEEQYLLPSAGHRIFILQPDVKWGEKKNKSTSAEMQLLEACALIETLPGWHIIEKATYSLKHEDKKHVYGKGNFLTITNHIKRTSAATAVFVNIEMLSALQLLTMQKAWRIPVYDRYTIVLQIFQTHARTHEAKLQVALAEIPFLRSRLRGIHEGTLGKQKGGLSVVGGSGETHLTIRQRILQEREMKLKAALKRIKLRRQVLKKGRKQHELPTVAVVGYTNAGKTSLIKALTNDASMTPRNQLFATLDVTAHTGYLGNHLKLLYIDTVGFMSDLPVDLIASFSATLEDMLEADTIIHVYDASHPDIQAQCENVHQTLSGLNLPPTLTDNMILVANKVDLLNTSDRNALMAGEDDTICVSTLTREGLPELAGRIHQAIIASTNRIQKHLKVSMSGPILSWLYKEATVESVKECPDDSESLLISVIMTQAQHAKFQAHFGQQKRKRK